MKKSVIRIICFISILFMILFGINKVFKVKYSDGIYGVTKFYELEDNIVDVLFLGSSHAFADFNTGVFWDEHGMASYVLSGSVQPMWNTYYYLKEALKTQKPKLIVLEGYLTTFTDEYSDDSRIIKNNYGLKWSSDKLNSIKISSPKERWAEFILEYEQYHTRYRELSAADFLPNQNYRLYDNWKGFGCSMDTWALESTDVSDVSEREALHDKTEKYYRMTLELAQENSIPIVVVISPYAGINKNEQKMFNTARDIAAEYEIPFVNYNLLLDEIGLDYSTDAADPGHLNYRGNQKYSSYLGEYLKSNYEFPDRRNDERYSSWQYMSDYVRQMIYNQTLKENNDINTIPDFLNNKNYWVFVSVDGTCNPTDETISLFLQKLGIPVDGSQGIWLNQYGKSNIWRSGPNASEQYIRTSAHDFCMRRNDNGINKIIIDNNEYKNVENGVNIVIYDTVTEKIIDNFGINIDDAYKVER